MSCYFKCKMKWYKISCHYQIKNSGPSERMVSSSIFPIEFPQSHHSGVLALWCSNLFIYSRSCYTASSVRYFFLQTAWLIRARFYRVYDSHKHANWTCFMYWIILLGCLRISQRHYLLSPLTEKNYSLRSKLSKVALKRTWRLRYTPEGEGTSLAENKRH